MVAAKIPNDWNGISLLTVILKNAIAVVREVANVAFAALLQVYAILFTLFFWSSTPGYLVFDCLQVSQNTNMSSAATPINTKIDKKWNYEK